MLAPLLTGPFEKSMSSIGGPVLADTYSMTRINGVLALACLRRWQIVHETTPPEMTAMTEEGGLPEPPLDLFVDAPLRLMTFDVETPIQHPYDQSMAARAGESIVYSVGPNGVDDQAQIDWFFQPNNQGDVLFRLPANP
jgi:hypothetical protein